MMGWILLEMQVVSMLYPLKRGYNPNKIATWGGSAGGYLSLLAVLKDTFGYRFEKERLSLSVDIKEMREGIALMDHNIPTVG